MEGGGGNRILGVDLLGGDVLWWGLSWDHVCLIKGHGVA